MPGVLPVLNRTAIEYIVKTGLAMNCRISPYSRFARKNYFYPDLPKGYQISQYELPVCEGGHVEFMVDGQLKKVGLTRIHLEEDAGKNLHEGIKDASHVDLNRTGVPLMEIVSEPDIRTPEEAAEYMRKLRTILRYIDVCDGNMEEGSLRCDANVSIRPVGQKEFGTRAELKNMNSFKNVAKAIEYEIRRQTQLIEDGGRVIQETRLWDANQGITISMRGKEEAHDYRYFPDPDLVPIEVSSSWLEEIRGTLPELPDAKKDRFVSQYGIPEYDAMVLTESRQMADYYERTAALSQPKLASNWIMGDVMRELKNDGAEIDDCPLTPENLSGMLKLIEDGTISGKIAKTVFEEIYRSGKTAEDVVREKGLVQITDDGAIIKVIEEVMAANPDKVADYRSGKDKLFGFFVGQVMKASGGKANPAKVNDLLREKLS
ncbi:MAG: Asp-tRNA(Asn)/Glu-tRNA(Gln) amidotransferase subunit GatB [Nitrospirae bacterium]|nr:Asp-tRNA(Asn)/Glu-tRNA(Gln) amidotransferase subunit GatB [Nitrospirota bacterium]